jgi:glucose-6-phosphate isomerase
MPLEVSASPELRDQAKNLIDEAVAAGFIPALFSGDAGLWGEEARSEASIRLGWVSHPALVAPMVAQIRALKETFKAQGVDTVVLCGMGGSSLAPEVMAACDGVGLTILDTTHPDGVNRIVSRDLSTVLVVVSSKSGNTLETDSQRRAFEAAFEAQGIDPVTRIVVVTDPGSPLYESAQGVGYRTFLGDPTVGGRFSALTAFGLVPSGLAGVDLYRLLDEAEQTWSQLQAPDASNPAVVLGALLACRYPKVNKVLLLESSELPGFGDWVEQLVAESTGKGEQGLLPVVGSSLEGAPDCVSVGAPGSKADITISGTLGEQIYLWLVATTVACRIIGVNPFDQPNVESAKLAARALLDAPDSGTAAQEHMIQGGSVWASAGDGDTVHNFSDVVAWCQSQTTAHSYVALCVFGDTAFAPQWREARRRLEQALGRPVTLGFGPRFLHSTGQFHKGGPREGVFLQVIQGGSSASAIPGREFSFGELMTAQALGDREVLAATRQATLSIVVDDTEALKRLIEVL